MLRYIPTKSIEGNRKISINISTRWKRNFTHSFFCSGSSHSCLFSMATETVLWRSHHNRLWLQLGVCATKPGPLTQLPAAPHVGSHHGWGWSWENVGAEVPGRILDQKCVEHRQSWQAERLWVCWWHWDVSLQESTGCLPGSLLHRTPFHWQNKRLFLSAFDLRKKITVIRIRSAESKDVIKTWLLRSKQQWRHPRTDVTQLEKST